MTKHVLVYLRAIGLSMALVALMVGTTLAALNTQATLTGTSLTTASADLLIWNGQQFSDSAAGFVATNIVPGIGSPEFKLSFRNTGAGPLAIGVHIPTDYVFSGFNSTSQSTAMKAVKVTLKDLFTSQETETSLYSLGLTTDVPMPGSPLGPGVSGEPANAVSLGNYSISFDVDPTAVGTGQAVIEPFDIVFTGKVAN